MKVVLILLITTSIALTSARPTFDKIAEAILNVIDEEIDPYHQRYPPTHPNNYQHGYQPVQQYPSGPIVGGYYQQPRPHSGYPGNYPPPPPGAYYAPNYNGNYGGYGYQPPPYETAQYGGGYRQPTLHHNYHHGYK